MQQPVISFCVRYRLSEYLAILSHHIAVEITRQKKERGKKIGSIDLLIARACFYIVAPPIFLYKVIRIGTCQFKFDDSGIVRNSKQGNLVVPWAKVSSIHEYAEGILFAKDGGAILIPLRVLSEVNLNILRQYITRHRRFPSQ